MVGAVCSGVRMSFPKFVCWLHEEGLISDLSEEDVDRLFKDRGLRHLVLRFGGLPCFGFHNVNLHPAVLGGSRLGLLGRASSGSFGQ